MKHFIRKDTILAIETRKGLYVLAQSIGNYTLVFFNIFYENIDQFNCIKLNKKDILCCITPVKTFFKKANIEKIKITPLLDIFDQNKKDHVTFELMSLAKTYIIYSGTKDELEINYWDGDLRLVNWKIEKIKKLDKIKDKRIIEKYQFDTMGMYGELNEKLYLSYRYGKYVEPLKDMIMNEKLPLEYKTYFLITSEKITEEEWLKLPIERKIE